jgi:tRNA A37 threonylcarbamoyladenosine dehydratase
MQTQSNLSDISEQLSRTEQLIGTDAQKKLQNAVVAVFGLGGVGSFTVEALARAGIGTILLIDNDRIKESNINRQLFATHSTIGMLKSDIALQRVKDINPTCNVKAYPIFYSKSAEKPLDVSLLSLDEELAKCSYIVDAIDTISSKLLLIEKAIKLSIPIVSCMGAGNKIDPCKFKIADIYKTEICPLARTIRHECKKRHIKHLKVLFSTEYPIIKQSPPASISYIPSIAGLMLASEVIRNLIKVK